MSKNHIKMNAASCFEAGASVRRVSLRALMLGAALVGAVSFSGCAALVVGAAAAGGATVATDRRTSGAQLDDQGIELRAASRIKEVTLGAANINIISYNRRVLLVGEMPNESLRGQINEVVKGVPNVSEVMNEVVAMPNSTFGQRGEDTVLTGKVKSTLLVVNGVPSNSIKVVSNKNVVYLMGLVTQREADLAKEATRRVAGVDRVVVYFEIITDEERNRLDLLSR